MVVDVEKTDAHDAGPEAGDDDDDDDDDDDGRHSKKSKVVSSKYQLDSAVLELINADTHNHKLWDDALPFVKHGQQVACLSR